MDHDGDPVETDQNQAENVINFKRKMALFLLQLMECNKLPSNAFECGKRNDRDSLLSSC